MTAAHRSLEYGRQFMLEELGLKPLLNLNLRLGEGAGAAVAMNIVEGAAQVIVQLGLCFSGGLLPPLKLRAS